MNVIVFGGTGFIGPDVLRELVAAGSALTIVHSGAHEPGLPTVRHVHAKWEELDHVLVELRAARPDVALAMSVMTEGVAETLLSAIAGVAPRLVVISSADVYRAYGRLQGSEPGPPEHMPLDEDAPLRERLFPYRSDPRRAADDPRRWMDDYDKILVERVFRSDTRVGWTILRLPFVHGPRSYRYFEYVKRMHDGRPVIPLGEGEARLRGTRGYVENVARAIALAVLSERGEGRVYNVGEADGVSEDSFVRALARATGWNGEIVVVPAARVPAELRERLRPGLTEVSEHHDLVLDTNRIRSELGYAETVPSEAGLERTVEWMTRNVPDVTHPVLRRERFDYAAEDALLEVLS